MAQTNVYVRTLHNAPSAVRWSGHRTLTIDRPEDAGGMGLGYSGGELLLLALGACYTNDIFREAKLRGVDVRAVAVEVHADWGGDPARAQNVTYSPPDVPGSAAVVLATLRGGIRAREHAT